MPDDKPVPEPGEAGREPDRIHYYEADETNVGESDRSKPPAADDDEQSENR